MLCSCPLMPRRACWTEGGGGSGTFLALAATPATLLAFATAAAASAKVISIRFFNLCCGSHDDMHTERLSFNSCCGTHDGIHQKMRLGTHFPPRRSPPLEYGSYLPSEQLLYMMRDRAMENKRPSRQNTRTNAVKSSQMIDQALSASKSTSTHSSC